MKSAPETNAPSNDEHHAVARSDRETIETAFHEAAHAVVGYYLGHPPTGTISIVQRGDISGFVSCDNVSEISDEEDGSSGRATWQTFEWQRRGALVHLAGGAAELIHDPRTPSFGGWRDDLDELAALVRSHENELWPRGFDFGATLATAVATVRVLWPAVSAAAAVLLRRGETSAHDLIPQFLPKFTATQWRVAAKNLGFGVRELRALARRPVALAQFVDRDRVTFERGPNGALRIGARDQAAIGRLLRVAGAVGLGLAELMQLLLDRASAGGTDDEAAPRR